MTQDFHLYSPLPVALNLNRRFTLTLRGQSNSPTSVSISNTADYSKIFLITALSTLTEGGLECVECQFMHVRCIPEHVSPKLAIIITQQGFFYSDLMHSYKTITYTNNNFITLASL